MLMYGENGSGKSSVYYALHCMFQSPLKSDVGKKYFNVKNDDGTPNEQHLKNLNNLDVDSLVWIDFNDRHPFIYLLDKNGYHATYVNGQHPLPASINGCFINHQFLFHFFNFRNSQKINLFPVFIKDILPFCKDDASGFHIGEMYDKLTSSIIKKGNRVDERYLNNIKAFNESVKIVVENINLYVSDLYKNYFMDEEENELQIRLRYDSNLDKPENDPNEYWLKYDRIIERVKENGEVKERLSSYKKLNTPFIGLEISEVLNDGKLRPILKPQSYFNEAKLTAIALSVRFALLNLDKEADGRFLALDDMLISLDMSNRAKVVKFLLDISDRYKIYLFTHDRMFFEYFKHKTKRYNNQWIYKEIYMDDLHQPYMRNSDSYIEEAEHYIKQHKYEIAGNFLRKAAEAFCKSFLPPKKQLSADYSRLDLNGMIVNSKDFAIASGMTNIQLFEELDEHRKFILNPSSHDSYDVEKYLYELKRCLNTLKKLDKINIHHFMKKGTKLEFTLKTPAPQTDEYKFEIVLCDDFKVVEQSGEVPVITKGMINYKVFKNGIAGKIQSDNTTLKRFYEVNYDKSDKTIDGNFLNSIVEIGTDRPIKDCMQ